MSLTLPSISIVFLFIFQLQEKALQLWPTLQYRIVCPTDRRDVLHSHKRLETITVISGTPHVMISWLDRLTNQLFVGRLLTDHHCICGRAASNALLNCAPWGWPLAATRSRQSKHYSVVMPQGPIISVRAKLPFKWQYYKALLQWPQSSIRSFSRDLSSASMHGRPIPFTLHT